MELVMAGQRLEQARGHVGVVMGGTGDGEEVLVGGEVTKVVSHSGGPQWRSSRKRWP